MASTYENDLRLEEMATGENSGSWGTKTNTNLELIADAFSYGTETIADADTTITIADGAADAARSLALKINSSADLTTTRTITLAPNTTSKVWIIENNTSGGQTLTISAGSGSNVTLANGTTKIIATDGIGAGSNVVELTQDLAIADMSVDGILSLADGSNSAPSLTNTGDTNTGLYFPAADEVGLSVGGTQRLNVSATGIDVTGTVTMDGGSTSADFTFGDNDKAIFGAGSDLQIYHDGANNYIDGQTGSIIIQNTNDDYNVIIKSDNGSGGLADYFRANGNTGAALMYHYGSEKLATTSAGVDITGGFTATAGSTITTADNTSQLTLISTDADASSGPQLDLYRNSASPAVNDNAGKIKFISRNDNSQDVTYSEFYITTPDVSDGTEDGQLHIDTMVAGTSRSRIKLMPTETVFNENSINLDFRVESNTDEYALFLDGETGGVQMGGSSDYTGSIGIDADGRLGLVNTGNGHAGVSMYRADHSISGGNTLGQISAYNDDTNGNAVVELVRISMAADGTFSATDNPTKLEFYTTPDASETIREVARFDNAGNFRMAATSGTIYTETSGTSNLRIGQDAGDNIASGGNYNTLIGTDAGTAITTGDSNVALGYRALYSEDAHGDNTAIGVGALQTLNAGTNAANVSIGNNSGTTLSDGVRNVIIGYNAASAATTPDDSVIIGWEAAHNATLTGHDNVIIGSRAGYNSTSGANVFIGKEAGIYHSTGLYNTFVGYQAGYGNTSAHLTGNDNTAVGMFAGYLLQGNAFGNSLFGTHSGDAITTGQRNTAVGFGALNSETTGTRAVAVGYNALAVQNLATESHNTSVGYNSSGTLSSGNDNTALGYGAFDDCVDGNNNTALGHATLSADCGSNNTAVGNEALNDTTGDSNTAVGSGAGDLITSGAKNSILGRYNGNQGGLDIRTASNNIVLSDGDGNPRGVFDSSGNFMVGAVAKETQGVTLYGTGANGFYIKTTDTCGYLITRAGQGAGSGTIATIYSDTTVVGSITVTASSTAYNTSSDHRLKENVVELTGATDRLKQLEPKRFNFIADADTTVDGFIAHEVQSVVPEAITGTHNEVDADGNPVYQGIDQSKLVPLLVATIKELEARITALENA